MNTRTVANVESWERRPAGGDLGAVVDRGFSGAVRAGDSYGFVVAGRPVGVFDYRENPTGDPTVTPTDVDAVSTPDEAFVAPHDALPLLYAMQATGGETRGRYYSNDTPLAEVDRTLQEGGFTGYVELAENVLSGDYYLVYHGGTRRAVAFVGQSRRLKTDDEAFDLASDEVGIFTVERVSLPNLSFPDGVADSSAGGGAAGAAGAAGATGAAAAASADGADETGDDTATDSPEVDASDDSPSDADSTGAVDDPSALSDVGASTADGDAADTGSGSTSDIDIDITPRTRREAERDEAASTEDSDATVTAESDVDASDADSASDLSSEDPDATVPDTGPSPTSSADSAVDDDPASDGDGSTTADSGSATDTETADGASPPDADPSDAPPAVVRVAESEEAPAAPEGEASQEDVAAATAAVDAQEERPTDDTEPEETEDPEAASAESAVDPDHVVPSVDPDRSGRRAADPSGNGAESAETSAEEPAEATDETVERSVDTVIDGDTVAGLRSELTEREAAIEELQERLAAAETENEELREQIAALERRLEAAGAAPDSADRALSPAEALAGTSLFVRYRSKRDPTLEDVRDGAEPSAVAENLRLEHHTQFDASSVSVDGRSFDAFLTSTQGYAFVEWLVESLPYEIRDTGNADSLGALYEAVPALDRIEFDGEVDLGESTVTFDLVGRDRMGQPLFVANLEDVREPTDEQALGTLVNDATAVAERHESLAGSFAVTSAYFEPAALETANEATSGSLLSRSKRKSFVKLSRNQGFHLGLVEDRDESFYLAVPEL